MSLESMRKYVEGRLTTFMQTNYPSFDLRYTNVKVSSDSVVPHVQLTIIDGAARQMEIRSDSPSRHVGVIHIDVLVPENSGTSELNLVSESIGKYFRRIDTYLTDNARLVTRESAYRYNGVNGGYARQVVSVGYWREEKV